MSRAPRQLKDRDEAEVAFRLKAFTWSLGTLFMGFAFGFLLVARGAPIWVWLVAAVGFWACGYYGTLWMSERAGRFGASIYFGSGSSTPGRREYSLGESLVARGRYDAAAEEYENQAALHPEDPEPCLRLARLLRDQLDRPADSVRWFRQAMTRPECDAGLQLLTLRELVEVCTHRLREPARALPDLARYADARPGTAGGAWAAAERSRLKQHLRGEQAG